MLLIKSVVLLSIVFNFVCGYRVLVFFPYPGKSHTILGEGFVRHLVDAGHDVTYVTPIPIKNPASNLRQVDVSSNLQGFALEKILDISKLMNNEIDILSVHNMYTLLHDIAEMCIKHENVQKLLVDPYEGFDVAIVEWLYSELYSGIPAVFGCPYIWSSSMEPHPMVLRLIDEFPNPAYSPDHVSPVQPPLTFIQRVGELWNLAHLFYIRWQLSSIESKAFREAFSPAFAKKGRPLPSIEDIKYNASMLFGNSHVSTGWAWRLPQNYVPIAGYHIKKEVPPLPEDLKKIMDNAQHGVIYFSLGTMMKGKTMPEELKLGLLRMFCELNQTVIWKLEEKPSKLPQNVHILERAPQPSILAHPNCVLFITHGGLLSTTETLHYGVPIIGLPLFADQFLNIERAVYKGFAKHVPLGYNTPETLREAIHEVISNPRYRQKAKELSLLYHDRPVSPGQEIVHWVEHVIKTNGAPHIKSIALQVPWYQKLYLDLLLVVIVVLLTLIKLLKTLLVNKYKSKKKVD